MTIQVMWLTDIHLNFVTQDEVTDYLDAVRRQAPDAIMLGGDIGEAESIVTYLQQIDQAWDCPVYLVLGNHDFYRGSIATVREQVGRLADRSQHLVYLTDQTEPVTLSERVGLIGHDGWADARIGDYLRSLVMMNDYRLIDELRDHDKKSRWGVLQKLGDEAAEHVGRLLPRAFESFDEVFLLTHVPPFREACWYDGQISNDEWAPHFTCLAMGNTIREVMRRHPEQRLTVFCGHTHGDGVAYPLPNVTVETGGAEYGTPGIVRAFPVE